VILRAELCHSAAGCWRVTDIAEGCTVSAVCCPLSVVCCLLSAVRCPLSVVCCLLSAVCCPLSAVCCPLSVVCCLLSVVCCPLSALRVATVQATQCSVHVVNTHSLITAQHKPADVTRYTGRNMFHHRPPLVTIFIIPYNHHKTHCRARQDPALIFLYHTASNHTQQPAFFIR
jgi:hypothetical protein